MGLTVFRLIGFTAAAVAAVAVFVAAGPDAVTRFTPIAVEGNQELIDQAVADYQQQSEAAGDDIEVQQLVNGWVARDLLFVIANQADATSEQIAVLSAQTVANAQAGDPDDRVAGLLLIGVLTLAFHGATAPSTWSRAGRPSPTADPTSSASTLPELEKTSE